MPIINHSIDENGEVKFTIKTIEYNLTETLTLQQVLALDPNQIYLYQNSYNEWDKNRVREIKQLQLKIHSMLMDYIEVGHDSAVLEIIETALSSDRLPSSDILLIISDILLKPTKIKGSIKKKEIMERLYKVHTIFLRILEKFGSEPLAMMLPIFGTQHTGRYRRQGVAYTFDGVFDFQEQKENINETQVGNHDMDDDDDDAQPGNGLASYDSFWDLASSCFSTKLDKMTLEGLGTRLMLDIFVKAFTNDLKLKYNMNLLSDCLLLSTIPLNSYNERTKLDTYIDIIFEGLKKPSTLTRETANHIYAENAQYASELLNMFILLSYCDQLAQPNLIERTYRQMISLNHDVLLYVLQAIEYPGFLTAICELYFQDSDYSGVTKEYQCYRKLRYKPTIKKMVHYIMKTQPKGNLNRKNIYLHCIMVLWYWNSYIRETHYRSDNSVASPLSLSPSLSPTSPSTLVTVKQHIDTETLNIKDILRWKSHIKQLLKQCRKEDNDLYSLEISCIFDTLKATV